MDRMLVVVFDNESKPMKGKLLASNWIGKAASASMDTPFLPSPPMVKRR